MSSFPTVRELMETSSPRLKRDMSVTEAIGILLDHRITGATVVDDEGRVVGMLSEKDCLQTLLKGAYQQLPPGTVADYMVDQVVTVDPDTDIFELAELYLKRVYRRFPVVEDGKLIGEVTRRDLLRFIAKYSK